MNFISRHKWATVFVLAELGDMLTTAIFTSMGLQEANPMVYILGWGWSIVAKIFFAGISSVFIGWIEELGYEGAAGFLAGMAASAVVWNIFVIAVTLFSGG